MNRLALLAVAALGGALGFAAVPAAPSLPADCSVDVTAALNQRLAATPDGSTITLRAGGCYRIDGTLRVIDRNNLTVNGNGATLKAVSTPPASPKITRQLVLIQGGSNIVVRDLTAQGTNPSPTFNVAREWFPLFEVAGAKDVLLERVVGRNAWGDFVHARPDQRTQDNSGTGRGAVLADGVTVRSADVRTIGRHAVAVTGADRVTVEDSVFTDIGYHVVDVEVEGSAWHARDIVVRRNTIGGKLALSVLASGDSSGGDITRLAVTDNKMLTAPVSCAPPVDTYATATTRRDWIIARNEFRTLGNVMKLHGIENLTVDRNLGRVGSAGCTNSGTALGMSNTVGTVTENTFPGANRLVVRGVNLTVGFCGNTPATAGEGPCAP